MAVAGGAETPAGGSAVSCPPGALAQLGFLSAGGQSERSRRYPQPQLIPGSSRKPASSGERTSSAEQSATEASREGYGAQKGPGHLKKADLLWAGWPAPQAWWKDPAVPTPPSPGSAGCPFCSSRLRVMAPLWSPWEPWRLYCSATCRAPGGDQGEVLRSVLGSAELCSALEGPPWGCVVPAAPTQTLGSRCQLLPQLYLVWLSSSPKRGVIAFHPQEGAVGPPDVCTERPERRRSTWLVVGGA